MVFDMESGSSLRICNSRNGEQRLEDVAQAVIGLLRNGKLVCAFVRGCNLLNPGLKEKWIKCLSDIFIFGVCVSMRSRSA
jgi:hypothetical protein